MCGRYYEDLSDEEIRAHFGLEAADGTSSPHYNIAPGQPIRAVRVRSKTGRRTIDQVHWGLVPHFASDRKGASRAINARAETVDSAPLFRRAFQRHRCLVPARGFYEWRREPDRRQPFAVARSDGAPIAFAGLWESWLDKESGEWLRSVAIVTARANPLLMPVHDRMPVILEPEQFAAWLGEAPATPEELKSMLRPSSAALHLWPVSPRVNRSEFDDRALLEPIAG